MRKKYERKYSFYILFTQTRKAFRTFSNDELLSVVQILLRSWLASWKNSSWEVHLKGDSISCVTWNKRRADTISWTSEVLIPGTFGQHAWETGQFDFNGDPACYESWGSETRNPLRLTPNRLQSAGPCAMNGLNSTGTTIILSHASGSFLYKDRAEFPMEVWQPPVVSCQLVPWLQIVSGSHRSLSPPNRTSPGTWRKFVAQRKGNFLDIRDLPASYCERSS